MEMWKEPEKTESNQPSFLDYDQLDSQGSLEGNLCGLFQRKTTEKDIELRMIDLVVDEADWS